MEKISSCSAASGSDTSRRKEQQWKRKINAKKRRRKRNQDSVFILILAAVAVLVSSQFINQSNALRSLSNLMDDLSNIFNDNTSHAVIDDSWKGYNENRSITFVHVGKAGGSTIRQATAIKCGVDATTRSEACVRRAFPSTNTPNYHSHVLSLQTQHYFHMWGYRPHAINASTSLMFALRNPIDRILSSFKYHHPANCVLTKEDCVTKKIPACGSSAACISKYKHGNRKPVKAVYQECFPTANLEVFAQSTMSPFPDNTLALPITTQQQLNDKNYDCPKIAREMAQGSYTSAADYHMFYNYNYYVMKTIHSFPNQTFELFGIRTEHEWDDLLDLDKQIGGRGNATEYKNFGESANPTTQVSNRPDGGGVVAKSSPTSSSSLSQTARHKLCCVLENEIKVYLDLIHQVLNLSRDDKYQQEYNLKVQCGLIKREGIVVSNDQNSTTTQNTDSTKEEIMSWDDWRLQCKQHLWEDAQTLYNTTSN